MRSIASNAQPKKRQIVQRLAREEPKRIQKASVVKLPPSLSQENAA
jgi:hypothetical protein